METTKVLNKKKTLVPTLRFKGFAAAWKSLKFPEVIIKSNQGVNTTTENVQYSEGGNVVIRSNNISENSIDLSDVKYVDEETFSRIKEPCKPKKGDILYCNIGSALGSSAIFNSNERVTINWNVFRIQPDLKMVDNIFLSQNLNRTRKTMRRFATESTMPFISSKVFNRIYLNIPTLPEQQKIASFLSAVDEKIQQLTHKKELLEQYKKGVMQQLFSGKLRFKDGNGKAYPKWEEKKLGEVSEIIAGGTPETNVPEYWDGEIQWYTPTEISERFVARSKRTISKAGLANSSAKLLPAGTILFTSRATIAELSFATEECATNQGFQSLIVNVNNNSGFIFYWIKNYKKIFIRKSQGSTFLEINKTEMTKIKIQTPCLDEQKKIADFLSAVDVKIEKVSKQITQTQTFKKGLLQQMFV